jgi:hypothetical protein
MKRLIERIEYLERELQQVNHNKLRFFFIFLLSSSIYPLVMNMKFNYQI